MSESLMVPKAWGYLKERTERQSVDFWHACEYSGKVAEVIFTER